MAIFASNKWAINAIDIKCAFLQGKSIERDIYVLPPKEFDDGNLWKLNTTVYGLKDASRIWYLKVKEQLMLLGCKVSKFDEALFYWYSDYFVWNFVFPC